ncbi:DNA cytosine methyltransferase [uncultured Methanobrevibacter sp.]|uniref:DNA cytosine methyltransferase n=1 Tax=uncultured Methanobrevibacter sp. TaxID=253161 RepID=UPI00258FBBF7|nr:DNA cytosine methyltransferase [uncultured Methanobrevibacter sp.]
MIKVLDLFCGCGGLSLGFQEAEFDIVKAFDNWEKAVEIYNANFFHQAELIDIYNLTTEYLDSFSPDVIIGGPPCQDYSSAGKQDESQGRANLTLRYAELVCSLNIEWFVMENVDRILKSQTLPKAISLFKSAQYGLSQVVLDASLCGVPQKRKRFFLIGHKNDTDDFLTSILYSDLSSKSKTVREYLGNELNTEYYYRHPRSYARRGIFSIDEPSATIRGVNRPIPNNYSIHPGDATKDLSKVRVLTTLERARIQTFPKSFNFSGNKTDLEQMIGNAVPVELAKYVAVHLMEYIQTYKKLYSNQTLSDSRA